MHQLLQALARRDFAAACTCIANEGWDAERLEEETAPLYEMLGGIRIDPVARRGHWTRIERRGPLEFGVVQTLVDDEGGGASQIEAEVVLEEARLPTGPALRLVGVRP
jgi:hypothetical protein